jgi:hypothetical protein
MDIAAIDYHKTVVARSDSFPHFDQTYACLFSHNDRHGHRALDSISGLLYQQYVRVLVSWAPMSRQALLSALMYENPSPACLAHSPAEVNK